MGEHDHNFGLKPQNDDPTFSVISAYGSDLWVASTLGRKIAWFRTNREKLGREGFPKRDPLTGLTIKADVMAWIEKRRRVSDGTVAPAQAEAQNRKKERTNAF
ncbi:hypothetical protein [Thioclava sp. GXIMD4216]|uniref:AlpA family phage regulatory protein n=1 Tax=Thioclava litoralis TaxID=3076557 RepID=A0ABZ1DYW9_9RHOB|nr:hypothetical protein RPE78_09460 [Thioclava sp. FTW29]